jgi:hypothetical protein
MWGELRKTREKEKKEERMTDRISQIVETRSFDGTE